MIETNTFNSTSVSMADYRMEALVPELNRAAAALAREACDAFEARDGRPRYVAGMLGPTNRTASLSPDVNDAGYRNVTFEQLVEAYAEAARGTDRGRRRPAHGRDRSSIPSTPRRPSSPSTRSRRPPGSGCR